MLWTFNTDQRIKECELRDNPIIIRVNKFDEQSAQEFCTNMSLAHCTGQEIIPIVIDSYGGQVYSLMRMIGAIKASRLPVATIVEGKAMSCGAILFSFGEEGKRYMDPHATVMIHDVSSGAIGKIEEIKANAKESERLSKIAINQYFNHLISEEGKIIKNLSVWGGKKKYTGAIPNQKIMVTIPTKVKNNFKMFVRYKLPLKAPLYKDKPIAELII